MESDLIYKVQDSQKVEFKYEDLIQYLRSITEEIQIDLDINRLGSTVFPKLKDINTQDEIDDQIIASVSELMIYHYDYPKIATYLTISKLHGLTESDYSLVVEKLVNNVDPNGEAAPIVTEDFHQFVKEHKDWINKEFRYEKDYNLSVFGYRTLEKSYLKKDHNDNIIERPQHLYMRVAIALHYRSLKAPQPVSIEEVLEKISETYHLISSGYFVHATPTLFNAGTMREQLSSCFLLGVDDSMQSIGKSWNDCANISKHAGGIGLHATKLRANGSYIRSTQGKASGLKALMVYNQIARYADQGGKRSGSIAVYLEPWHADIFMFLDLKKNTGPETERARDLFLALMVNDIFMERVQQDGMWSLMCPSSCPKLLDTYGENFTRIYQEYEAEGRFIKQIRARDLWFRILESHIETGTPYILFKDSINSKSNQCNVGVVNGSNLCAEIVEVSDENRYATCNLASICLPKFVVDGEFNYQELYRVTRIVTYNLNNVIDINYYPVIETKGLNYQTRPLGIGVQGLADVFNLLKIPYDSKEARKVNRTIFETIYFASLTESNSLAKIRGPYEYFKGSPLSQGLFQFNLWNLDPSKLSGLWNWDQLRSEIKSHGVLNSLTTACMPTASTSQIMDNNECFEPYTENIYSRSTLAGDFYVINKFLMKDLMELDMWTDRMVDLIKYHKGSIQNIHEIPERIREQHKTSWEIKQKSLIEMSADRAPFIDQTQSLNLFLDKPTNDKITSCLFYGWKLGLKTGMYYLRSKVASDANQFGIDIDLLQEQNQVCKMEDGCISCGS